MSIDSLGSGHENRQLQPKPISLTQPHGGK